MLQLVEANWILLAVALLLGFFVAWWVFSANRKVQVAKEDTGEADALAKRNQALIDAPPAAVAARPPLAAEPVAVKTAGTKAGTTAGADDLALIKGLGPKLNAQLADIGVTTFAQIAAWDDTDIDRVDAMLGRFQGRIRRDDWVAQARLLAAGDSAGFARQFGNG